MGTQFDYHRLVVGYHGCDRSVGEAVLLRQGTLQPSNNPWDWLGKGIYFWEHGPERAWEFAAWKQRRREVQEPFVLGAYIHLGRCFDLTDTAATSQLGVFYDDFKLDMEGEGLVLPLNRPGRGKDPDPDFIRRELDCAVLNHGLAKLESAANAVRVDTVRGVFVEGEPAYPDARIHLKTHVQIAVRDPQCIIGYFLPASL